MSRIKHSDKFGNETYPVKGEDYVKYGYGKGRNKNK
jgi:hypothetical protein